MPFPATSYNYCVMHSEKDTILRVLAVIPAFNEEVCLEQTVSNLIDTCPQIDYLVVNDGSKDRTEDICRKHGYPHLTMPVNCGLSCGFQAGMRYAKAHDYDAVIQFDADGQHLPEYIAPMADEISKGADIVIASRVLAGEGPVGARGAGSKLISWLIRVSSGISITDPTSGMRMFGKELIATYADGFDLAPEPDAIALFARKGKKIVEIPAHMQERQGGTSYLDLPNIMRYMSRTCISIILFQWFR